MFKRSLDAAPAFVAVAGSVRPNAPIIKRGQLKELEKDGIVTRTIDPQVPPRVEYALSEIGLALSPSIEALIDWTFMRREAETLTRSGEQG
jgi:hypothetical protein